MTQLARLNRLVARALLPVLAACAFATTAAVSAGASKLAAGRVVAAPASAAAVHQAIIAGASVSKVPSNLQPSLEDAANDYEHLNNQDCAEGVKKDDATFGECVYGAANAKKTFILFGDSHAAMWFDGLKEAATLAGWKMRIFTKSGCPVVQLTFYPPDVGAACNVWRTQAIAAIRKLKPTMIVLTSGSLDQAVSKNTGATSAQWETGMKATLTKLRAPHTKLVILGDIPVLKQSAPECLAAHESDVQSCSSPRIDALQGVLDNAESAAAKATGATRVDTTNWLCATICPPIVNNMLVYRNQFHITRTYSVYLAGVLRAALLR